MYTNKRYIFCGDSTYTLNGLIKRNNVIKHTGTSEEILEYNTDNTILVIPYTDDNPTYLNQKKELFDILIENNIDIDKPKSSVWVPINDNNHGIIFTSNYNLYWAIIAINELIDKVFDGESLTIVMDIEKFDIIHNFEESVSRALNANKKIDLSDIEYIYTCL